MARALRQSLLVSAALLLAGCETPTAPRYSISVDNSVALRSTAASDVAVGPFTQSATFNAVCRLAGPIYVPDNMTHVQYLRKAFEDEIRAAGLSSATPRTTITGDVSRLEFSSSRGVTGGSWTIAVKLSSTNGRSLDVFEHYTFDSGFMADAACAKVAQAYAWAVQNLIGVAVRDPTFPLLLR